MIKKKTENQNNYVEELTNHLSSKKAELLKHLEQQCSLSAYEIIEAVVNQLFP